jgi:hypothetical protein
MTIEEFERALDRHGGDFSRWPADLRARAEALVGANRTAAELARIALRLDRALAHAVEPLVLDAAFVGGITAGVDHRAVRDEVIRPTPRFVAWASMAAVAFLVTGYAIGLALPATNTVQSDDALASLIFGDTSSATTTGTIGDLL